MTLNEQIRELGRQLTSTDSLERRRAASEFADFLDSHGEDIHEAIDRGDMDETLFGHLFNLTLAVIHEQQQRIQDERSLILELIATSTNPDETRSRLYGRVHWLREGF